MINWINKLGYTDLKQLEDNLENNPEFKKWWDVIKELYHYSDELFELAHNSCQGLAHDELYKIVEKYERNT